MHHHAAQDVDRPGPDEHEGHLPPGDIVRATIIQCIVQIPFSIEGQVDFTSPS